jgi:hypothetical protein
MADQTGSLASVLKAAGSREGSSDVLFTKHAVGFHVSICDGIKVAQSCAKLQSASSLGLGIADTRDFEGESSCMRPQVRQNGRHNIRHLSAPTARMPWLWQTTGSWR